jgi:uncharacterized protein
MDLFALLLLIFAAAILYSSVGHGGASGYLAAMALFSIAPSVMRPTALTLNILVAGVGTIRFWRAGLLSWRILWPFAIASVPFAYLGGSIALPTTIYKQVLGIVLFYVAARLFFYRAVDVSALKGVPLPLAVIFGAAIGLLSGLTGVGGGIFLSPLLLFMGWATPRQASGVAAAFILVNSIAGLLAQLPSLQLLPPETLAYAAVAFPGSLIGTQIGTRWTGNLVIRRLLAAVLVIAAYKLLFT